MSTPLFYSDVTRGAFQMYSLKWDRRQRAAGHLHLRLCDGQLLSQKAPTAATTPTRVWTRCSPTRPRAPTRPAAARLRGSAADSGRDLPAINLWYRDTVVVHSRRLSHVVPTPSEATLFWRRRCWGIRANFDNRLIRSNPPVMRSWERCDVEGRSLSGRCANIMGAFEKRTAHMYGFSSFRDLRLRAEA